MDAVPVSPGKHLLPPRGALMTALMGLAALLAGLLAGPQPSIAIGLVGACVLVVLVFRAPAISTAILLFFTAVVPYGIQNRFGIGGSTDAPGLLISDVLLISALAWGLLTLLEQRLWRREFRFGVAFIAILALVGVQFARGLMAGGNLSSAGQELRVLLGIGVFLVALPLLADPRTRRQLHTGLLVIGLALGAWGVLQWFGHVSFGAAGDVGVRAGVRLTSEGSGQLQGGEYGFPVVIAMSCAILLSSVALSHRVRVALVLAIALNAVSCLVTFERTFWLDAVVGLSFVCLTAPGRQRAKALLAAPIVVLLVLGALSVGAPRLLATASERLLSLGQYSSDDSVRYRVVESRFVLDEIRERPLTGSGLGATIFWGQPWAQVPAKSYTFSHNGYLRLAWKLGIPLAVLLIMLVGRVILVRGPPGDDPLGTAVRRGAQGALLGLLCATVTFPSFSALSITYVVGALLALVVTESRRPPACTGGLAHTDPHAASTSQPRPGLVIAVIVPFLNEEWCLPVFLASMAAQTRPPDRLVLVDDGSTDRSVELATEFARSRTDVVVLKRPPRPPARDRLAEANELKAFEWAVEQLDLAWTVVAKMDADLQLGPATIETIERAFASEPQLGMAGARLTERQPDGSVAPLVSPPDHVEGATKFYRRACWSDIAPVPPILGWDTLDETHARMHGWRTRSVVVPGGEPLHLRRMGTHGSILRSFRRWGVCSYGYGAHPLQVLYYGLILMRNRRPRIIGGLNYLAGWALATARGAPRAGPEIRRAVRREQLAKARRRLRRGSPASARDVVAGGG